MKTCYLILWGCIAVLWSACSKGGEPEDPIVPADRTIVVYIAAHNDISSRAWQDVEEMSLAMKQVGDEKCNLLVYIDSYVGNPRLLRINAQGEQEVIETYEAENSASGVVLSRVLARAVERYPAESYGLILWSHGMSWKPSSVSAAKSLNEAPESPWLRTDQEPMTKWFGYDGRSGSYMELDELAIALSHSRFWDFILFDACLMNGVEVAYALRNATDYLIASPSEVMVEGMPYQLILPLLFEKSYDFPKVVHAVVEYFRTTTHPWSSMAVVQCDQLEALAETSRAVMRGADLLAFDASQVQYYEGIAPHLCYDIDDYYSRLSDNSGAYAAFKVQLDRTIRYAEATEYLYTDYSSSDNHRILVKHYSGLSTYIPRNLSTTQGLNAAFLETEWAKAVGINY